MARSHNHKQALPAAVAVVVAVILLSASSTVSIRNVPGDLCAQTTYPSLCRPVVNNIGNPFAATQATITALVAKTKEVKDTASEYKTGNQAIGVCFSSFGNALYNLEKAMNSMRAGDKRGLNNNLSAAMSDYGTCVDAFIESQQVNFLQYSAVQLRKMGSNCYWLSTLI